MPRTARHCARGALDGALRALTVLSLLLLLFLAIGPRTGLWPVTVLSGSAPRYGAGERSMGIAAPVPDRRNPTARLNECCVSSGRWRHSLSLLLPVWR